MQRLDDALAAGWIEECRRLREDPRYKNWKLPVWRPFQLAFVLMSLPALATPTHVERAGGQHRLPLPCTRQVGRDRIIPSSGQSRKMKLSLVIGAGVLVVGTAAFTYDQVEHSAAEGTLPTAATELVLSTCFTRRCR